MNRRDMLKTLGVSAAAVTGWGVTDVELLRVGERALAMARIFNAREGVLAKDDLLPPRSWEPLKAGEAVGEAIPETDMRDAIDLYYELLGWDKDTGIPTRSRLIQLGLEWCVEGTGVGTPEPPR